MPRPRLLALTTSQEEGGAESHLLTTLAAASARGYEIHVSFPHSTQTKELRGELRGAGYAVRTLPIGRTTSSRAGAYAAILADCAAVLWSIARVRPDAILLNLPTPEATPGSMLACALTRVPTTAIFHLVRSDLSVTRRRRRLYQLLARGSQRWVCVSEDNRETLAERFGVSPQRIAVVRNGANHRPMPPERRVHARAGLELPPEATLVLTTGRLGEQKEHRLIVEALPRLVALDAGLVFAWAGDGPLRAQLGDAVSATGLERHVRLLGRRDDVPELLAAADLFLMPSRDEGSPLALAEAMQAGLPAIVSDAGALTEVVEDRRNGLVFARGDADDLVRVIDWALAHRRELAQMAERGQEQALRDFTVDQMLEGLMAQITSASAGRPPA
jgi:glycosyltransferase involved in cell wall biosynthesis